MEWLIRQLGLKNVLSLLLKNNGLQDIISNLVSQFGYTDLFGGLVNNAFGTYASLGREAVVRMATIKSATLESWANRFRPGDPAAAAEVKTAFANLAGAFADAIGSLVPKK